MQGNKKKTVGGHVSIVYVCTTTRANPSIFSTGPSSSTTTTNRPSFAKANAIKWAYRRVAPKVCFNSQAATKKDVHSCKVYSWVHSNSFGLCYLNLKIPRLLTWSSHVLPNQLFIELIFLDVKLAVLNTYPTWKLYSSSLAFRHLEPNKHFVHVNNYIRRPGTYWQVKQRVDNCE